MLFYGQDNITMKEVMVTLLVCVIIYEIFEHLILPLFWAIRYGKRKSAYGPSGMIGKICVVKQWEGNRGKVWVGGELWNATSPSPLIPGSEAVIRDINNLTLLISLPDQLTQTSKNSIKR
jgi:membrane protein implicated in regulation of membrane protease activity